MPVLWEELTAKKFDVWVKKSEGVCILPIGVLEKHGSHLPLGTDMYIANAVSKKAAEQTSVVMFPYYFLGQIAEARHVKGTLAASHRLIMDAMLEMCDEIHRNGFTKILILNGHGGNEHFLPFFCQQFPGLNRPYSVYTYFLPNLTNEQLKAVQDRTGEDNMGEHAGFMETALMMHLRPDLVNMEEHKAPESVNLERMKNTEGLGVFSGFNWYSKFPYHFAGDASRATPPHGLYIFDILLANVVNVIQAVKADNVSAGLIKEYNDRAN